MATRSSRSGPSTDDLLAQLSLRDRLLFAQVVYELGCSDWNAVADLLAKHPLMKRPKGFFTAQTCHSIYVTLMNDIDIDFATKINLRLAQKYYKDRVTELKAQLLDNEEKFKAVVREVEDINAGKWDDRLAAEDAKRQAGLDEKRKKQKAGGSSTGLRRSARSGNRVSEPPTAPETPTSPNQSDNIASESPIAEEEAEAIPVDAPPGSSKAPSTEDGEPEDDSASQAEPSSELTELTQEAVQAGPADQDIEMEPSGASTPKVEPDADEDSEPPASPTVERRVTRRQTNARNNKGKAPEPASTRSRTASKSREATAATAEDDAAPKIPRVNEKGAIPRTMATSTAAASKRFQGVISMLHGQISTHRNGNLFHNPVKESEAEGYFDIVKRPMDLKTIKTRIKDGSIKDSLEFQRDILLMFANAKMYNRPDSEITRMSDQMLVDALRQIEEFRQTEQFRISD
ncbi:hypothetical protein FRB90_000841 [Tulasnella sp. 427]|nr:hypothetical protein FRB90_000841 [Tulasnella sp. 427]